MHYEPILNSSTQAAGVLQDTSAGKDGEGEGGQEETTVGYSAATSTALASQFLSQNTISVGCVIVLT